MSNVMEVMDPKGHTTVQWNPEVPAEVEVAESTFDAMIEQGYRAFRTTGPKNERGAAMTEFDAAAGRIVLIPQLVGG